MMKTYKKRPLYMERIRPYIDTDIIKVLIGQRRVGKSYILFQIMDELERDLGVDRENIIYINKELNEFDTMYDYNDLLTYIRSYTSCP
jgi:predicted AAA+ superfamily ATPase